MESARWLWGNRDIERETQVLAWTQRHPLRSRVHVQMGSSSSFLSHLSRGFGHGPPQGTLKEGPPRPIVTH